MYEHGSNGFHDHGAGIYFHQQNGGIYQDEHEQNAGLYFYQHEPRIEFHGSNGFYEEHEKNGGLHDKGPAIKLCYGQNNPC